MAGQIDLISFAHEHGLDRPYGRRKLRAEANTKNLAHGIADDVRTGEDLFRLKAVPPRREYRRIKALAIETVKLFAREIARAQIDRCWTSRFVEDMWTRVDARWSNNSSTTWTRRTVLGIHRLTVIRMSGSPARVPSCIGRYTNCLLRARSNRPKAATLLATALLIGLTSGRGILAGASLCLPPI